MSMPSIIHRGPSRARWHWRAGSDGVSHLLSGSAAAAGGGASGKERTPSEPARERVARTDRTQGGSVLIVVLWVCLGLVSVSLMFGHSMMMALRGSDNGIAGREAEQAIEGGIRYAESILLTSGSGGLTPDTTLYQSEKLPVGEAAFWFLGQPTTTDTSNQAVYGLVDEASKLNLNNVNVNILQNLPGMTAELAAAIIDWRDSDENITSGGAESETYLRKKPAYRAKNAAFETPDELALVNGATLAILYGEDANQNGVLDPNEDDGDKSPPADNSDGTLDPGVLHYLTTFTSEPNTVTGGTTARINVSTISNPVRTMLTSTFGQARGGEIATAATNSLQPGQSFRSVLEFYTKSGMKAEEFDQIYDAITTGTGATMTGLVNVNTASETVLACIPGLEDKAANIIAARTGRAASTTPSLAWVGDLIGPQAARQAGPYLTGRSFQMSADIAAVGRHGRGFRRSRVVIDMATGTTRVVYRRNLARLGWALGATVREDYAMKTDAEATP